MSTTELVPAKDILKDLQEKFGIEDETWTSSYTKTAQSKNITIQEWNRVVKKVSANSSSTEALYTALEDSLALFGALDEKVDEFDDRIAANKTAIEDEAIRAKAAEGDLANAIKAEKNRAEGREAELAKAIEDEARARLAADDTHTSDIETNRQNIAANAGNINTLDTKYGTLNDAFKDFKAAVEDILDIGDGDPKLEEKLNELHEIIAYINSNKSLIDEITINKVNVVDIIDALNVAAPAKPLSANQGVVLKGLISALETALNTETANRKTAITAEETARKSADATHTTAIAALKTRLDSLDLPILQHSLYEHSVVLTGSGADGVYPQAKLWFTILNNSETALTAAEAIAYLNSSAELGEVLKTFSGFVEYESAPGATDSILIPVDISRITPSTDTLGVNYYDSTGQEVSIEIGASANVHDSVRIVADVAEGGGNGIAIIECLELPTQNVSTKHFYRTPDGRVHWNDGTSWHAVPEDKFDYIAEPTTILLEKTEDTPYVQEDSYGFWYRVSDRYIPSHHLVGSVVKGSFYNDGTTDVTIPSYEIDHTIVQGNITVLEGGYYVLINGERVIHVVSDYEAYAAASRVSLNANGVHVRYYDREFVEGHKTYTIDSILYAAYAISDTALEHSSAFRKAIDEASKAHLKGWDTYNEDAAMRKRGSLGVYGSEQTYEASRLLGDGLELTDVEGMRTYYKKGSIHNEVFNVDDIANPKYYTYGLPRKSGTIALLSDIVSGSSGNTYFVGTLAEYEAQKDTIAVGTLIIITDEGELDGEGAEFVAILGKAILGKAILGKGA